MKVEHNTYIPLYRQIENMIKDNITNGTWKKGDKIPTEQELIQTLKVSRGTLRKAIGSLVDDNFLVQKQGKGTFVTNNDFSVPLTEGLHSFYEHMKDMGLDFKTLIITKEVRNASDDLANKLGIRPGTKYLFLERIRIVDNEVVMFIENNINISEAPGIFHADFTNKSLFSIIEAYSDSTVSYSETRFAAVEAGKSKSEIFKIHAESPLLYQEQIVHLTNSRIIELGKVWLRSNRFYVGTILQRQKPM